MDNIITIDLFGRQYQFQADGNLADAKLVAERINTEVENVRDQLSGKTKQLPAMAILLQASLNIFDRYYLLQKEYEGLAGTVHHRSERLLTRLKNALPDN